ncbi:MAG: gliding motility-associated C-terminal domain-containing protein [Cyclobacteriaceae bacterium]
MTHCFKVLSLLLLLLSTQIANSQNLSTEGTDFWFGFMNNWVGFDAASNPIILEVYISAEDSTSGQLEMPGISSFSPITFDVVPGEATLIQLSASTAMAGSNSGIYNRGIHLTSEDQVSVFGINKRQYSADETVILPTFSLSNEYLVMSHWESGNRNNNNNSNSELYVVATDDNTVVEITPSVATLNGFAANTPFKVNLNKGDTYLLMARGDLTGSRVEATSSDNNSCKDIAVFAGNQYTQVGECGVTNGHDHLFAQMFPLKTWGREFITVNYEPRSGGDIVKVLARDDNTTINIANETIILDRGEYAQRQLDGVNNIIADKPVTVGQLSRTQGCDNSLGDPFLILLSPNEQLLSDITFNAPGIVTTSTFSLNIIAPRQRIDALRLDGGSIGGSFKVVPNNTDFVYARFTITGGNHTIKSENGFIAYVYGYGSNESFGYSAGASLANLSLSVDIRNSHGVKVPIDSLCHNDLLEFTPIADFEYDSYEWDFGDGTTIESFDQNPVFYNYGKEGIFVLKVTGITSDFNCEGGSEQTEVRVLNLTNPKRPILGARSVCPFTENVLYVTENPGQLNNEWFVEGGTIVANYRDSIRVNWGMTSDVSSVKLLPQDKFLCYGDTVTFPVKINLKLEPAAAIGNDSICANEASNQAYFAYYFEESVYEWQIEGGSILQGQGEQEVIVDWNASGINKLWYLQSVPGKDICEGTSDTLFVFVQRVPETDLEIIHDKTSYEINESATLSVKADTLYQLVNWLVDDVVKIDSALLNEPINLHFSCPGTYVIKAAAFDTVGICSEIAENTININWSPPKPQIINVTNDTSVSNRIIINSAVSNNNFGNYTYSLVRSQRGNQLSTILTPDQFSVTENTQSDLVYTYGLSVKEDSCTEIFTSALHSNMVIKSAGSQIENEAKIEWTPYAGWENGVSNYEVYLSVDEKPATLIGTTSDETFNYTNDNLGFDHCFRVKASEEGGNDSFSWSNEVCVFFKPKLHAHNVFTPNGDPFNQFFTIEKVEIFANSRLTITDRSGNRVFEKKNYQNDWDGDNHPAGTYYFMLELNEPRIDRKVINGYFTIIK